MCVSTSESLNHVLVLCPFAKSLINKISQWCNINFGDAMQQMHRNYWMWLQDEVDVQRKELGDSYLLWFDLVYLESEER